MDGLPVISSYIKNLYHQYAETTTKFFGDITVRDHQFFSALYFVFNELTNGMLFYHSTGTGKTITTCYIIYLARILYPDWTIFILVKKSLLDVPWLSTLEKFDLTDQYTFVMNYDYSGFTEKFNSYSGSIKSGSRIMFIVDEAHQFISRSMPSQLDDLDTGPRLLKPVYDFIKSKMSNRVNKLLLLTATPLVNSFNELVSIVELIRADKLPSSNVFNTVFIYNNTLIHADLIKRCLAGMISVHTTDDIQSVFDLEQSNVNDEVVDNKVATLPNYASKHVKILPLTMSPLQLQNYVEVNVLGDKYKDYNATAAAAPTLIKDDADGGGGADDDGLKVVADVKVYAKDPIYIKDTFFNIGRSCCKFLLTTKRKQKSYFTTIEEYRKYITNFVDEFNSLINFVLPPDLLDTFKIPDLNDTLYTSVSYIQNLIQNVDVSALNILYDSSTKYFNACRYIISSPGKCLLFEPLLQGEGSAILKIYMRAFNIKYLEYSGSISSIGRIEVKNRFDSVDNIRGADYKVVIISKAGMEGIEFTNVRTIIFTDMYWSDANLNQSIGRGIRFNSHNQLDPDERNVTILFLLAVSSTMVKTADEKIYELVRDKAVVLTPLLQVLKESSIETLYKTESSVSGDEAQSKFDFSFDYLYQIYKGIIARRSRKYSKLKLKVIYFTFKLGRDLSNVYRGYREIAGDTVYASISNSLVKVGTVRTPAKTKIFTSSKGSQKTLVFEVERIKTTAVSISDSIEDYKSLAERTTIH